MAATELERALADAGGADAPRELSARLRRLLADELARGERELAERRTGYGQPIAVAVAAGEGELLCALPLPAALRADAGAVTDRAAELAAAAVERVVEAVDPGPPPSADGLSLLLGEWEGHLAIAYPAAAPREAADYAKEALDEAFTGIDRLRARAHAVPGHVLEPVEDPRPPIGPTHPLRVAEAVARLGGSPLDEESMEALEPRLVELLEPAGSVARAHEDPDPVRRVARRILQRLDGMGKWGGYHTAFDHLARGFAGNERALAYDVGEALVDAQLLQEKPNVGQRHVYLNPRRSGEIRRLIDEGEVPAGLTLP
ncbi:MAG TPA: hypothetical protein VGF25_18800 [Thermoleophilaceae bacterium]